MNAKEVKDIERNEYEGINIAFPDKAVISFMKRLHIVRRTVMPYYIPAVKKWEQESVKVGRAAIRSQLSA